MKKINKIGQVFALIAQLFMVVRCQPSSIKLALADFLKNVQKMVKNDKNQQNGSSLCTHSSTVYAGI